MSALDISLYGIIDPEHCNDRPLGLLARQSAETGVTLVQYRNKGEDVREMIADAKAIKESLSATGVPLIINDRVDIALASGADGVHLGQQDMLAEDARRVLGDKAIIGLSIKKVEEAQNCPVELLDYAFVGGVFETQSKNNPTAIGIDGWIERANIIKNKAPDFPVGAIAGIDVTNIGSLVEAGCDGVAMISSIYKADDVTVATRELRQAMEMAG